MKWIGQHIVDLIARFRGDVYLEDVDTGTIASGGNLGLDSNNKIVKATETTGDITGVDLTGAGPIVISSETGTTSGDYSATIGIASASDTVIGAVELATTAETTTGTDTTRAVTPDGLKDGYQGSTNVTTLGTIGTGTWNGTAIASAYLDSDTAHLSSMQTFTGKKTFSDVLLFDGDKDVTPGDGAVIHIDAHDITDINTSASATTAAFNHVLIEPPRLMATNASVTTTNASTLYIKGPPTASTNQTITNAYSLLVDSGDVKIDEDLYLAGTLRFDNTSLSAVQTSSESFADNNTSLMTSAAIDDKINTKYAYQYIMFHASDTIKSNWITFGQNGLTNHTWGTDTSDSGVTVGSSTMSCTNVMQVAAFKIPFACKLVGFYGTGHRYGGSNSFAAGVFILDSPDYNSEASGSTVDTLNATLRAYAAAEDGGVSNPFNQKLNKVVDTSRSFDCPAGSMIFPAFKDTAGVDSGSFRGNMTVILATPIATIA